MAYVGSLRYHAAEGSLLRTAVRCMMDVKLREGEIMAKSSANPRQVHERTTGEERDKMIQATRAEIEKKFGSGSIMRYGDGGPQLEVEAIPTGALALDAALGIGGVPRGRIIEI